MRSIAHKKIYLLITACVGLLFSSCLNEEGTGDCFSEVDLRVYFEYLDNEKNPKQRGINPDDIDRIELYAYDEAGLFYDRWIDEVPKVTKDYYIPITLQPGKYTLVAWGGNQQEEYIIQPQGVGRGEIDAGNSTLYLNRSEDNGITYIQHHLFYAASEKEIEVKEESQSFVLPVVQDTYTINLSVECFEEVGNELEIHIYDDNGSYHFDNSFVADSLHYYQTFSHNEMNYYTGLIRVMRLADYRHPRLVIYDATAEIIRLDTDLVELLKQMYRSGLIADLDFEHLYEYDIPLSFCAGSTDGKVQLVVDMEAWRIALGGIIFGE